MKLFMIAPAQIPVPPRSGGSVEYSMHQIAKQLSRKHKVTVYSRKIGKLRPVTHHGQLKIIRVQSDKKSYLATVIKKLQSQRPLGANAVIQIDNRPSYVPAVKNHFPHTTVSLFLHSLTYVSPPMTTRGAASKHVARADLIVGNSQSLKRQLMNRFPHSRKKIHSVYLGADLAQFKPPSEEQRQSIRRRHDVSGKFVIAFAGRLIPRKGIPALIRAAAIVKKSIPSVILVIAGGSQLPSYRSYLRRLANQENVPVKFLGRVPRKQMHTVYWMADCFVCPSQKHEAFGLVVAEALASGVPTVASKIGGIPEIIRHEKDGLLVTHYRNPSAIAHQILQIATRPELASRLARQGRQRIRSLFSWKHTAEQLAALYSSRNNKKNQTKTND